MPIPFSFIKSGRPPLQQIGTVVTDTFDRTTGLGANYTTVGGATWTVSDGNNLAVSNGAINFARYARYSAYGSCLEQYTITIEYNIGTIGASSLGLGIGAQSINSNYTGHVRGLLVTDNTANQGKVFLYQQTTSKANSSGALTIASNDEVRVTLTRAYNVYTITAENLTTPGSVSVSYTFATNDSSGTGNPNNTCNYALYALGGSQTVRYWNVASTGYKNVKTCIVGDSITNGKFAELNSMRYASLVNYNSSNDFHVNAGGGDTTQQVLDRMPEVLNINAQYYMLMIGGNDIEYGVSSATWQANYTSIVNQLKAIGATVVHLTPTPRTSVDVSALRTYIYANFATDPIIDTYTRLLGTGTSPVTNLVAGDGIHPTSPGMRAIADYILDNGMAYVPTITQTLDTDTQAYVTAVNAVATWPMGWTRRQMYDDLIRCLKTETGVDGITSLWNSLDRLWIYTTYEEVAALIDIRGLTTATKVGATPLPWTIDNMYDGNGIGYLASGFNPGNGGSHKFLQSNASYFEWNVNNAAGTINDAGALNASNLGFSFNGRDASNRFSMRMNGNTVLTLTGVTDGSGMLMVKLNGTSLSGSRNGVALGSSPVSYTSSVLVNLPIDLFSSNNNGTHVVGSRNKRTQGFGNSNLDDLKLYNGIRNKIMLPLNITGA